MGENARFENGHARVETRVLKNTSMSKWFFDLFSAMVDSVSVRFKNARVKKMLLNIRIQWNAGTACVSECVLKTLACRGLRVGPSKRTAISPSAIKIPAGRGDEYGDSEGSSSIVQQLIFNEGLHNMLHITTCCMSVTQDLLPSSTNICICVCTACAFDRAQYLAVLVQISHLPRSASLVPVLADMNFQFPSKDIHALAATGFSHRGFDFRATD